MKGGEEGKTEVGMGLEIFQACLAYYHSIVVLVLITGTLLPDEAQS